MKKVKSPKSFSTKVERRVQSLLDHWLGQWEQAEGTKNVGRVFKDNVDRAVESFAQFLSEEVQPPSKKNHPRPSRVV